MGIAASVSGANGISMWTPLEAAENARAIEIQNFSAGFVGEHFFCGFPTRAGKQSEDPLSALWLEIAVECLEDLETPNDEGFTKLNKNLLNSVPTGVLIDKSGNLKTIFSKTSISYDLSANDIKNAIGLLRSVTRVPSQPNPPYLEHAGTSILSIQWDFPHPPGLSQQVELQFVSASQFSPHRTLAASDKSSATGVLPIKRPKEHQWHLLITRSWCFDDFNSYTFNDLMPGTGFYFRIRIWSHEGWSLFSEISQLIQTAATCPSRPGAPIIAVSMSTCMQLRWPAVNGNGSKIKWYILRLQNGLDNFDEIYKGSLNSFLVMNLQSDSLYSFDVAAENDIGLSEFSPGSMGRTHTMKSVNCSPESPQTLAALECREAWSECWDPKTEQYFYFNSLTGTRQLSRPDALLADPEGLERNLTDENTPEGSLQGPSPISTDEELKRIQDSEFRRKRFRLLRAVHQHSAALIKRLTGHKEDDAPPSKARQETFSVELRRSHLLLDGYRAISRAPLTMLTHRLKITFKDEEGIDSGGLGKEAFLLLSKDAAVFAGTQHKGWMAESGYEKGPGGKTTVSDDGGLFFTEKQPEKSEVIGDRLHALGSRGVGRRKSSLSLLAPFTALTRRSSWRQVSESNGSRLVTNNCPDSDTALPSNASVHNTSMVDKIDDTAGLSGVGLSANILDTQEHITSESFFKFLGRFLGKALFDRQLVDLPLAFLLLKHMVGDVAEGDKEGDREGDSSDGTFKPALQTPPVGAGSKTSVGGQRNLGRTPILAPTPTPTLLHPITPSQVLTVSHTTATPPLDIRPRPAPVRGLKRDEGAGMGTKATPLGHKCPNCNPTQESDVTPHDPTHPVPSSSTLSDDDLADFPDEITPHARQSVSKLLLQALVDVRTLDLILYKSLLWMINNDITDVIDETFSVAVSGSDRTVALCKDGDNRGVTQANKYEYVELVARWKTTFSVAASLNPFLQGFHELVPVKTLRAANITAGELGLMLNGKPDIDVEDLRPYVIFQGNFNEQNETVLWLWQSMREMDEASRRSLLRFFTGCTRVPLDGFDPPLNITEGADMLQLVLPSYSTYDMLKDRILFAVHNTRGFELA